MGDAGDALPRMPPALALPRIDRGVRRMEGNQPAGDCCPPRDGDPSMTTGTPVASPAATETWTPPDHSGPAMKEAAEMIARDFEEAAKHLERAVAVCRLLEQRTGAVNGTSAVVRAQTKQLADALAKLRAEGAEI